MSPALRKCPHVTTTDVRLRAHAPVASRLAGARPGNICIVVPQIAGGEGSAIARNLRRRGNHQALVLARRSEARELVQLLAGGVRGAVAIEQSRELAPQGRELEPTTAPAPLPLTAREISVLSLVAEGQSNRNIGESLNLSALTVKSHLARIARKLGTGDRAALVAVALRRGLI